MSETQSPPAADSPQPEEAEVDPCLDQLKRERADFLTYRHCADRERAADRERERPDVVRELVPAIDDLDRALEHTPRELAEHLWALCIALARDRFLDALSRAGWNASAR